MNAHIPEDKVTMGIANIDPKGDEKGTTYWCTTTFQFKITDTRESVIAKTMQAFDIAQRNLIKG